MTFFAAADTGVTTVLTTVTARGRPVVDLQTGTGQVQKLALAIKTLTPVKKRRDAEAVFNRVLTVGPVTIGH
jgi:hypothetical protein